MSTSVASAVLTSEGSELVSLSFSLKKTRDEANNTKAEREVLFTVAELTKGENKNATSRWGLF